MRGWKTKNGEGMIRLHGICKLTAGLKNCFSNSDILCTRATLPLYFSCNSSVTIREVLDWDFAIFPSMLKV